VKNVNQSVDEEYIVNLLKANDGKIFKSQLDQNEPVDQVWDTAHETDRIEEAFGTPEDSSEVENALVLKEEVTR